MPKESKNTKKQKTTTKSVPKPSESKHNTQTIIIAVLATALAFVLILLVLFLTGVLSFGNGTDSNNQNAPSTVKPGTFIPEPTDTHNNDSSSSTNGNAKSLNCYDETRVRAERLEFCLPDDFRFSNVENGVYTYNLIDDDGWADVKIHIKRSQQSPTQYLTNLSSALKISNQREVINQTDWVRAEADNYMLGFATKSNDYIYAVIYTIKLASDETREAWNMIPKTLNFSK